MSVTALRELVVKIGFNVDESGFKQAEADIDAIKKSLGQLDSSVDKSAARMQRAGRGMASGTGRARSGVRTAAAGAAEGTTAASSAAAPRGAARRAAARVGARVGEDSGAPARRRAARGRERDERGRFIGGKGGKGGGDAAAAAAGGLGGLGGAIAALGIGATIKEMITLASDADETQNVLKEVFGEQGKAQINAWADATSKSMGRSSFLLRENAGALGALIEPMVGNAAQAQEMSQRFAGLAVDLGSFFNASDEDALAALKSGISGEAEPLKRFGILMNEATLAEFAHAQGISKKVSAMSNAEKTDLRYQFILAKSTKAQGDAARTTDGFANSSKRLQGELRDAGIAIGQKLLPVAGKLGGMLSKVIGWIKELVSQSAILETTLIVLAGAFAAVKIQAMLAFAGPALAIAALVLGIEDLYQLFTGGESVIGTWLDTVFGIGTAQTVVEGFTDASKWLGETWQAISDTWAALPDLSGMIDLIIGGLENFGAAVADYAMKPVEKLIGLFNDLANAGRGVARFLGFDAPDQQADAIGRATGRGLGAGVMTDEQRREARTSELDAAVRQGAAERAAAREEIRNRKYAAGQGVDAGTRTFGVAAPSASAPVITAPAAPAAAPAAAAAGGKSVAVTNGPVTINVGAGASSSDAARAAARAVQAERRRTQEAISRTGG